MLIGLVGKAGSGKDTFFDVAKKFGFKKLSLAQPMKQAVSILFGWKEKDLDNLSFKETKDPFWGVSPREILQWLGTEIFRENLPRSFPDYPHGDNFWIRCLERRLQEEKHERVVVTDVRFPNEQDFILSKGGILVHIHRPGSEGTRNHASEALIEEMAGKCHFTLSNDSTLVSYKNKVETLLRCLLCNLS